jgi:hypothetical protein
MVAEHDRLGTRRCLFNIIDYLPMHLYDGGLGLYPDQVRGLMPDETYVIIIALILCNGVLPNHIIAVPVKQRRGRCRDDGE